MRSISALSALPGAGAVTVKVYSKIISHTVQRGLKIMPNVKNIIAVASGKGGVGKSTVSTNLAVALARMGRKVGLVDADIYGPSQPQMLGISGGRPESKDGKSMEPMQAHGIQAMSIGLLIDPEQPQERVTAEGLNHKLVSRALALEAKVPPLEAIRVIVSQTQAKGLLPDPMSCTAAVKAGIDGLVDAGVIPDDTGVHVKAVTFLAAEKAERDSLTLLIEEGKDQ